MTTKTKHLRHCKFQDNTSDLGTQEGTGIDTEVTPKPSRNIIYLFFHFHGSQSFSHLVRLFFNLTEVCDLFLIFFVYRSNIRKLKSFGKLVHLIVFGI